MDKPNKPRLADITKKSTVDRASKLAGGFLPPPPAPVPVSEAPSPAEPASQSLKEVIEKGEADLAQGRGTIFTPDEVEALVEPDLTTTAKPQPPEQPKERSRRSMSPVDMSELLNQPVPEGLRCTRMIMLCDDHHDLLRNLSYTKKKPMTHVLFNLLEFASQALQREKKKGA